MILELKVIADVGIVGFPNVGKSTLISVISDAKPKIADYPFTTLTPNLGVVKIDIGKNYVVADIPGLIEGASEGKGLGLEFLRHIERTKVLLFMLDATSKDVKKDFKVLVNELKNYNKELLQKEKVIVINKLDVIPQEQWKELLKINFGKNYPKPMGISAATGFGVEQLKYILWEKVDSIRKIEQSLK